MSALSHFGRTTRPRMRSQDRAAAKRAWLSRCGLSGVGRDCAARAGRVGR